MLRCSRCGASNGATARFCEQCGQPLLHACPNCSAPVASSARFCPACGATLTATPVSGQERKVVTVLFADVVGSTGLGEHLDPEQVRELMAMYFSAMRAEIEAEGGTVEKFIGDAVMAVFGVPRAHEDDRARALRAALRMQRALESLNGDIERTHGVALRMRIGVNTGEVVVTPEPRPGEGMVAGDTVNVAARLEQSAEPGHIVASERTVRALNGFTIRPLGAMSLRGKEQQLDAVEVVGESAVASRGIPGLRAPMIGRDHELGLLTALLQRCASENRPQLVTVYGEAGVGKSRLLAEFMAVSAVVRVLRGRCLPYGEGVTYWPLAEVLKTHAAVSDEDSPASVVAKISAAVTRLALDAATDARVAAALAYTIGIEHPDISFRDLAPRQVSAEIHSAWRAFFTALAERDMVVFVVEDIHWADQALLDVLGDIAERARGALLVLCTARPELTARHPEWGGGKRNFSSIALEPLSAKDAAALMHSLLAAADLEPALRARILDRAEGNPFFLEEILRQFIDEGRLVRQGSGWRAASVLSAVAIPDTVQEVIAARVDLLTAADKRSLQMAAVVGRIFWTQPLQLLLNGEAFQLDEILDRLEERELVQSRTASSMFGHREYIFKHILTRDVAYASLPRRERGAAHAAVAGWLEQSSGERRLEMVELLAYHYGEALRLERDQGASTEQVATLRAGAYSAHMEASLDALSKFAVAKATAYAQQAADIADSDIARARAFEALGAAAFVVYEGDEAWRCYREAADLRLRVADTSRDGRLALAMSCARVCELPTRWPGVMRVRPDTNQVEPYWRAGMAAAGEEDSEARVLLLMAEAMWSWSYGEGISDAAETAAKEACAVAERIGRPLLESAASDALASVYQQTQRVPEQNAVYERRLLLAPRIDDVLELGDMHAMAAWTRVDIGRYRAAVEIGVKGYGLTVEAVPTVAAHCAFWSCIACFRLGDWDQALHWIGEIRRLLAERESDPPVALAPAYTIEFYIRDARGEMAAATQLRSWLLTRYGPQSTEPDRMVGPMAVMLSALARRGERTAWDVMPHLGRGAMHVRGVEAECDAAWVLRMWDHAEELARRVHQSFAELAPVNAFAERLEAGAAWAAGDTLGAVGLLESAEQRFAACEARWELARTQLTLAELLLELGRGDEARQRADAARSVFQALSTPDELVAADRLLATVA